MPEQDKDWSAVHQHTVTSTCKEGAAGVKAKRRDLSDHVATREPYMRLGYLVGHAGVKTSWPYINNMTMKCEVEAAREKLHLILSAGR